MRKYLLKMLQMKICDCYECFDNFPSWPPPTPHHQFGPKVGDFFYFFFKFLYYLANYEIYFNLIIFAFFLA